MIGKILNLSYQKIANNVHGEMEQNKRRSSKEHANEKSNQEKKNSDEKKEKPQSQEICLEVSKEELMSWVNELNLLESYVANHLHFTISFEGKYHLVKLIDQNGHALQEYLPVQFKALYSQLKSDSENSKKGTILNLSC